MSTERQIKRSSPSVIAKLMGLDALPSPGFRRQHKEVSNCSQKVSSKKELQRPTTHENCLLKKHSDEYQECKDVFEVIEGQQLDNHKNQGFRKQMPNLKHSEMDMAFIRQSFINAKLLSTDENLQKSKEFDDALEVLESNKDLFLKLLQEPHSLFTEHLHNRCQSSPSQSTIHASTWNSSRESLSANHESPLISEIKLERYTSTKNSDSHSLRHHAANSNGHPFSEPMCSLPEKCSGSIYGGKVEDFIPPTHIVILKPNLKKARKVERTARSVTSLGDSKHAVINRRELSKEEIVDFFQEGRDRRNLHTLGNMRPRTKQTVELAKSVTQHMRNSSVTGRKTSIPKYSNCRRDDDLWHMSTIASAKHSPDSYRTYDNIPPHGKTFSPSPSCAIESSVNMEARKQLSEQRKLTCHLHEIGISMRASDTLSEMMILSDKEISKTARHMPSLKKACPSVIGGKDGWKDGFSRNLSRSKSLPASSLVYRNSEHNSRKGVVSSRSRLMLKNIHNMNSEEFVDKFGSKNYYLKDRGEHPNKNKLHSDGEESRLPVREILVRSDKFENTPHGLSLTEEERTTCNLSDIRCPDMADIFSVPFRNIAEPSFSMKCKDLEELRKVIHSERTEEHIECGHGEMLSKQESSGHGGDVLLPSNCPKSMEFSPIRSKEADQPSPVSVSVPSSKDSRSAPGCFEEISADLQELRRQLQMLMFDSDNVFGKEIEAFISSDEDASEPFSQLGDIHRSFRDEEDRDYSYLLDMLIDSGVLKSDKDGHLGACGLIDLPVGMHVFDKLEKKYRSVESWSKSGRKLLFDLVNSTVSDIAAVPFLNMCPSRRPSPCWQAKMAYQGLVEEIWQVVAKIRKEGGTRSEADLVGLKWFGSGNTDSEVVGAELENMLSENLMDELVEELMFL